MGSDNKIVGVIIIVLVVVFGALVYGVYQDRSGDSGTLEFPTDFTTTVETGNGDNMNNEELIIEDLKEGTGDEAKTGSEVSVHYTGTLTDGTKFDSSLDRDQPFSFPLGEGRVIKGWDQGVVGMKVGGKRKLTIPSELAYGEKGSPPNIGPNETLIFEIELLDIVN